MAPAHLLSLKAIRAGEPMMHSSGSEYSCFCSASRPSWFVAGIHTCRPSKVSANSTGGQCQRVSAHDTADQHLCSAKRVQDKICMVKTPASVVCYGSAGTGVALRHRPPSLRSAPTLTCKQLTLSGLIVCDRCHNDVWSLCLKAMRRGVSALQGEKLSS